MRFANSEMFQLLWLVLFFICLTLLQDFRIKKKLEGQLGLKLMPFLTSSVSWKRRRWKLFLRVMMATFFIVALARPQFGKSEKEIKQTGVEIVVAMDVSNSMLVEDVKPSRLHHAKSEITRFIDELHGDKVGLVAFAGSAILMSPLTTDKSALKMFLDTLSPDSVGTQGTDFGKALDEANKAFQRGGLESDENLHITRVIVVASDGEDQDSRALEKAKQLAEKGARIFTMAFGTAQGGPIPLRDDRGYLQRYKKSSDGKEIISQVKGEFLRDLAQVGHGSFHHATFGGNEAKKIKDEIDRLEKFDFATSKVVDYDEKFQIPLAIGIIFVLLDLLVSDRKGGRVWWRGRFEVAHLILFALFFGISQNGWANDLRGIVANNEGGQLLQKERTAEAHESFLRALKDLPFSSVLHFNLGTSFLMKKEYEKALSEYQGVLRLLPQSSDAKFSIFEASEVGIKPFENAPAVASKEDSLDKKDMEGTPNQPSEHEEPSAESDAKPQGGAASASNQNQLSSAVEAVDEMDVERANQVRFFTYFNMGVALTQLKRNDEALLAYQNALVFEPNSIETKTNMELLTQSMQGGSSGENQQEGDGQGNDQKQNQDKNQDKNQDQDQQKKQPPRSNSNERDGKKSEPQNLSQKDIERIFEELIRQEDDIRAKLQDKGGKDAAPGKDW